jgi:chromosome segregation ATPase
MEEGFVDLRQSDAAVGSASFWPSFTDIMMVVVMIFMIASVVLMLRNWELLHEQRATMDAKIKAEELARSAAETSETLEERLVRAQSEISRLRMQLMRATEIVDLKSRKLTEAEEHVLALETEKQKLSGGLQTATRQLTEIGEQLRQRSTEYERLQETHAATDTRLKATLEQLAGLEDTSRQQAIDLAELRKTSSLTEEQLLTLQGDYDTLQVKYDKLVKPARTARGKYVVSVRYWKDKDYYHIDYKEPDDASFIPLTKSALYGHLDKLKAKYGNTLYIKVIIPEDSGLSYSEAWGFTFDVLKKYDYYHQED